MLALLLRCTLLWLILGSSLGKGKAEEATKLGQSKLSGLKDKYASGGSSAPAAGVRPSYTSRTSSSTASTPPPIAPRRSPAPPAYDSVEPPQPPARKNPPPPPIVSRKSHSMEEKKVDWLQVKNDPREKQAFFDLLDSVCPFSSK